MERSLAGLATLVVGGSRGLGRGAALALAARGAEVTVLGRDSAALAHLATEVPGLSTIAADARDEASAERALREVSPKLLVIVAGAHPVIGPFHEMSWADFETNWQADTKLAFVWLRAALRRPLAPGAHVIVTSSGAAVAGSPASGGYASAKRAQWFLADYAANESERAGLGLRVHCVLPGLNNSTDLGRAGIAIYARRSGVTEEAFVAKMGPQLTPSIFGAAIASLAESPDQWEQRAYRVGAGGLTAV